MKAISASCGVISVWCLKKMEALNGRFLLLIIIIINIDIALFFEITQSVVMKTINSYHPTVSYWMINISSCTRFVQQDIYIYVCVCVCLWSNIECCSMTLLETSSTHGQHRFLVKKTEINWLFSHETVVCENEKNNQFISVFFQFSVQGYLYGSDVREWFDEIFPKSGYNLLRKSSRTNRNQEKGSRIIRRWV